MNRIIPLIFIAVVSNGCVCTVVDPGNRGVKVNLGEVDSKLLDEGLHFKSPLSSVTEVSIRQRTSETNADAFSSDLQHVGVKLKILYRVPQSAVINIFQNYSGDPFDALVVPRVQEALKEVTATLSAEQIAKAREDVKQNALALVRKKVGEIVMVEDLVVENVTLSQELQRAIEAKMVQEQEAAKARFTQQKAQIEAETAVVRAKGEAEALKIRGDALRENPKVLEMNLIEKWNGVSPLVVGGSGGAGNLILPLDLRSTNK